MISDEDGPGSKILGNMESIGRLNVAMEEAVKMSCCGIVCLSKNMSKV